MKLKTILEEICTASKNSIFKQNVTLVAVSKTKSVEEILSLYEQGQRIFGENYVDELTEKAGKLPKDIRWHFIGHLQSNKIKTLLSIPNVECIQTIDSINLCDKLNKKLGQQNRSMKIFVQVKLSEEESKFGIEVADLPKLLNHIKINCKFLDFVGLMTIGPIGDISIFKTLFDIKNSLEKEGGYQKIELSMGMSADFKEAVLQGASFVRIGSALFGPRDKKSLNK